MEVAKTLSKKNKKFNFDNVAYSLVLFLGFFIPLFFFPFFNISVGVSKSVLISTFAAVAFFLWLIARLKDGRFVFPKSLVLLAGAFLPIALFFSAVFSDAVGSSFVGLGYEIDTFSSILVLYILMFLSSIFFQLQKRMFYLYIALFSSAIVVFLYQLLRFVFLSFDFPFVEIFFQLPGNLIGKWVDMSIFFGFITILSLTAIELASLGSKVKKALYALVGISMLILALVNFKLSWVIVGIFSLIIFVYTLSFGNNSIKNSSERRIPTAPFTVLLISLFFILSGSLIGDAIYSFFKIPQEILRPSWTQTVDVAKNSLIENPVWGAGPNRFTSQWLLFKPAEINNSILWNMNFTAGVGFIPSSMMVAGGVGIIAWVIFLLAFVYRGIRSVFLLRVKAAHSYIIVSSFLSSLYLWVFLFFYVPNIVIIFLAFLMTGVFIASLAEAKLIKNYDFSFLEDPRIGFVSVLVLILLIISSIVGGYVLFQKFLSVGYFQRSMIAFNVEGNLDKAEQNIFRAIKLNRNDLYYRTLSEMNLARLNRILSQSGVSKETVRAEFQAMSDEAIKNAISATEIDKTNYLNWVILAKVYQSLMLFGAPEKFYDSAQNAYNTAVLLNPKDPSLTLARARLEISAENKEKAKEYIAQALNQKNNYTEAIFLLSQIQESEGNLKDAIASAEVASMVAPNDMGTFFQLGLLRYKTKDYSGAVSAFGRAVDLNPNYSNAKYFLGISLSKIGNKNSAIQQFKEISLLNPDNVEVKNILENLKAGRNPFDNVSVKAPENRDDLPIEE